MTAQPTVTLTTAGAGSGATVTLVGTEQAGSISLTTGTGCSVNAQIMSVIPTCSYTSMVMKLSAANDAAAGARIAVSGSTSSDTFSVSSTGGTSLTDSTTYQWSYVIGSF